MANWKKIIVSGSIAELSIVSASGFSGSFSGDGSGLTGVAGTFPTVYLPDPDAQTQYFVFDGGSSKFISGSQLSSSIFAAVHGDVTITADGTATVAAGVTQTADTASTVAVTVHGETPDPIYLVGVSNVGNGQILYGAKQSGHELMIDPSDNALKINNHLIIGAPGTETTSFISASATTFDLLNNSVTTLNIGGAATTINMGTSTGTVNIAGSASIAGDLIVRGAVTSIETENLNVTDQFILLNSASADPNSDGGIIVQTDANGNGTVMFYDDSSNRWALAQSSSVAWNAASATAHQYVVSVSQSAAAPTGNPSNFGLEDTSWYGMMYVDTSDTTNGGLYVYLP